MNCLKVTGKDFTKLIKDNKELFGCRTKEDAGYVAKELLKQAELGSKETKAIYRI